MALDGTRYIGGYERLLVDPKGRVILPALLRRALPGKIRHLILSAWFDGCLAAFDPTSWGLLVRSFLKKRTNPEEARMFARTFAGKAIEVRIDTKGRILITRHFLTLVGIGNRATIIGALDHIEIWDPDRYRTHSQHLDTTHLA